MYGGHITNDWDRRLCRTYLEEYMQPNQVWRKGPQRVNYNVLFDLFLKILDILSSIFFFFFRFSKNFIRVRGHYFFVQDPSVVSLNLLEEAEGFRPKK